MTKRLMKRFALSEEGAKGLVRAVAACTVADLMLMLPVGLLYLLASDFLSGSVRSGRYPLYGLGIVVALLLILLSEFWKYNATYFSTYLESGACRIRLAEKLRRLPLSFFGKKDLADLTNTIMGDVQITDVVFPSLGCRFVSVLDCLDSEGDNTDMLHFRSLMNDYHLRDLSSKIKSVLHSKKASGQFISAYAPYGYRKSDGDKHKLVIDEYAAGIVRRIYDMRLAGTAYGQIAAALNRDGITSPRVYWSQINGKDGCKAAQLWTYATVKTILHNEVYKGTLVMNHTGTL